MNRLVVFSFMMVAIVAILTLKNYKSYPISNERFDVAKAQEAYLAHVKELAELEARRHPVEKVVEEVKVVGPLVVLSTPQLERGANLYKKCIVCHGKRAEGKKSQNAPRIGGQFSSYVEKQILAMKNGSRINKKMIPYIKKLSSEDIKDLSVYLSKVPWGK